MDGADVAGPELLEGGGPERERRPESSADGSPDPGRPPGSSGLLSRYRGPLAWVTVVVVVAGYLVVQWRGNQDPAAPPVVVNADRSTDSEPLWSPGRDGRPISAVTLSVTTELALPVRATPNTRLTPLGLTGPGLTSPGVFPHMAIGTHVQGFDLTGQVACDRVPLPVPPTAYQMRMQVDNGSRRSTVEVPLPLAASDVAKRVTYGCSTWLAARDLTVSTTAVTVSPTESHLQVTVQVRNDGSHDGVVWMGSTDGTGIRVSDLVLTVPAHATASADLTVDLDTCWTWDASSTPLTTTDTPLPLLGAVGVDQPLPADALPTSQGVTGLVLAPGAGRTLQDAFVQACGGIAAPLLSTGVHSSQYVVGTQTLSTRVMVDLPTPSVQRVRFVPVTDPTRAGPAVPTYAPSPWLGLDSTGRVGWPLTYLEAPNIVCITGGGGVFVSTDVQAQVRTPQGTTRVVTFRLAAEALLPSPQIRAACDAMNAAGA